MYRVFAFIGKIIIPILVIILSIITVLPESGLHIEQLRKDGVYGKAAQELKKNIFQLDDNLLAKIGFVFPNKEIIDKNPTLAKVYSDLADESKIEANIKDTIESQFKNLESNIKNSNPNFNTNTIEGKIGSYANKLYSFSLPILIGVFLLLFLILALGLFKTNKSFSKLSRFYSGTSFNLLSLGLLSFVGLAGAGFVGTLTRRLLSDYVGIKGFSVELLDVINLSWGKFVATLFVPALIVFGITMALALFFAFLSLFQRDNKEAKAVKQKMESTFTKSNNKNSTQLIDEDETVELEEVTVNPTPVYTQSVKQVNNSNNFKPVSSNPFPIEETRAREDLDPFLDRLSHTLNDTSSVVESGAQKIVLPSDRR
jgi:hypothetical protein